MGSLHKIMDDPVTTEASCRNSADFSRYYTPTSGTKNERSIADYITGYVDGEGCFTVTFNKKAAALLGWELRPSFSVGQNEDRRQVLDLMRTYFGCGYIRRDYADKTVKFEVRGHRDLMRAIIPHFEGFPLLSAKQRDFELFRTICHAVGAKEHLDRSGFVRILKMAYQMNGSGKRRRTQEEIINDLRER